MVSVNSPKPASDFCSDQQPITTRPVFRAPIGGGQVEPAIDVTKGIPGPCSLNFSLMSAIQPALAGIAPVLTILDAVATMSNCVVLTSQVFTNPTKIPDLLGCIPQLVAKVNQLLALVPPFPQGYAQVITSIVDALRVAQQSLICLSQQLTSVQQSLEQVERDIASLTTLPEGPARTRMQELIDCGMQSAEDTVSTATASLGPIARVLCAVRAILILQGDSGKQLAQQLSFPDVSNPANLTAAIDAINLVTSVLEVGITVAETIGAGIGAPFPVPDLVFTCPLDDDPSNFDTTPPAPLPAPVITDILDGATGVTLGSPPAFVTGSADQVVLIIGSNFINTDQSIPYFGTDPLSNAVVETSTQIRVTIPAGNKTNDVNTFINVVNQPPGGTVTPFSGLSDPVSGQSTDSEIVPGTPISITVS